MLDNTYVKPSDILVNDYNSRVKGFSSRAKRDVTWVLEDNDQLEDVKVTVSIPGFPDQVTTISRKRLPDLIPVTTSDFVVIDLDAVQSSMTLSKSQKQLCKTFNITHPADARLYTKAFAHAVLLWSTHEVLISPNMVDIVDLIGTQEATDYANTITGTLVDLVEIKPIRGALDYVGAIKVASVTSTVIQPPAPPVDPVDPTDPVDPVGPTLTPEWTVVEYDAVTGNGFEGMGDVSNYSMFKKSGTVSKDKESTDGSAVGYLSAAYYTLQEGDVVRLNMGQYVTDAQFTAFLGNSTDVAVFGESQTIHYPFGMLTGEPSTETTKSMGVEIHREMFTITHLDGLGGQITEKYNYEPDEGESLYLEYAYKNGVVTVNINGISTLTLQSENRTIIVPLVDGELGQELGGISTLHSEYRSVTDASLQKPAWAVIPEVDTRPINELPTSQFKIESNGEAMSPTLRLEFDNRIGNVWSLRDSSDTEICGSDNFVQASYGYMYFVERLNASYYENIAVELGDLIVAEETYTLYSTSVLLRLGYNNPGSERQGDIVIIDIAEGMRKFSVSASGDKITLPTTIPTTIEVLDSIYSSSIEQTTDISGWDVSNVKVFNRTFQGGSLFNQDISGWDVSNVTDMQGMFNSTDAFNQDISTWNVSKVTNMTEMFSNATAFNQDLSQWCTVHISISPSSFADGTTAWTLPKPAWGTCPRGEVPLPPPVEPPSDYGVMVFTTINNTAIAAGENKSLDMKLRMTDVGRPWVLYESGVRIADSQVSTINTIDKNICNYELHCKDEVTLTVTGAEIDELNVTQFCETAYGCKFNDTNVKLAVPSELPSTYHWTDNMFLNCTNFNQDISGWDTSKINTMSDMFKGCIKFTQPIGNWDVSSISSSGNMSSMFENALAFNQNLSGWCVGNILTKPVDFDTLSGLTPEQLPVWGTCPRGEDAPSP